ncbi:MAG: hypothetical protein LBG82_07545 [Clostridiales Family XIII bacterium]|jgi:hypothetical protein|nr:hypothetical protein [Clostridiales Family XIII bacterium]
MKQFIVLLAILPLTLGLIMQMGLAQSNFSRIAAAESIVRGNAAPAAADAGGFTSDILAAMVLRLESACGIPPSDVAIDADSKAGADGTISYRVSVPIRRLVAAPGIFGIDPKDNSAVYTIEGTVYRRMPPEETEEAEDAHDKTEKTSKAAVETTSAGTGEDKNMN